MFEFPEGNHEAYPIRSMYCEERTSAGWNSAAAWRAAICSFGSQSLLIAAALIPDRSTGVGPLKRAFAWGEAATQLPRATPRAIPACAFRWMVNIDSV